MTSEAFTIKGFIYSSNDRLEFDMTVPIEPPSLSLDIPELNKYAKLKTMEFAPDIQSAFNAHCHVCAKPARENLMNTVSLLHLPPAGTPWMGNPSPGPKLNLYISAVCSMAGPCSQEAKELGLLAAVPTQAPEANMDIDTEDYEPGMYPRSGSCATCNKKKGKKLLKCARCKMTQYCTRECQKEDWARHKTVCKLFTGVRAVDSHGNLTTRK